MFLLVVLTKNFPCVSLLISYVKLGKQSWASAGSSILRIRNSSRLIHCIQLHHITSYTYITYVCKYISLTWNWDLLIISVWYEYVCTYKMPGHKFPRKARLIYSLLSPFTLRPGPAFGLSPSASLHYPLTHCTTLTLLSHSRSKAIKSCCETYSIELIHT
jgi:hypothetical protein